MEKYLTSNLLKNPKIIDLLEKRDFESLYLQLARYDRSKFTEECLQAGVNPLEYMDRIPPYYLCNSFSDSSLVIIPKNIKTIEGEALFYTLLSELAYEGTVQEFEDISKQPLWAPTTLREVHCADGDWKSPNSYEDNVTNHLRINTAVQIKTGTSFPDINQTPQGTVFYNAATQEVYVAMGSTWTRVTSVSIDQNVQYVSAGNRPLAVSSPTVDIYY